jgi:hypothetical protein
MMNNERISGTASMNYGRLTWANAMRQNTVKFAVEQHPRVIRQTYDNAMNKTAVITLAGALVAVLLPTGCITADRGPTTTIAPTVAPTVGLPTVNLG